MEPFVFATGNADKAREAGEIFGSALGAELETCPLTFDGATFGYLVGDRASVNALATTMQAAIMSAPNVEETGSTLAENARIKALGVHTATGALCVADDTGLIVDALGGRPGVRSARYAGERATYGDNVRLLLDELASVRQPERTARFVTAIHVIDPAGAEYALMGEVEGHIAVETTGSGTFGYDPVFIPNEGDGRSFAEMSPSDKHAMSHRGRALRACAELLLNRSQ